MGDVGNAMPLLGFVFDNFKEPKQFSAIGMSPIVTTCKGLF